MKYVDTPELRLRLLSEVLGREGRLAADARAALITADADDHAAAATALAAAEDALEDAVDGVHDEVGRGEVPTDVDILAAYLTLHSAVTCLADAVEAVLDLTRPEADG